MRSLVLRIYVALVAVLLVFAALAGWLVNRHFEAERQAVRLALAERAASWAALAREALPPPEAPAPQQALALQSLSQGLRLPLALEDAQGARLATSEAFARREAQREAQREARAADDSSHTRGGRWRERALTRLPLGDGRALLVWRPAGRAGPYPPFGPDGPAGAYPPSGPAGAFPPFGPPGPRGPMDDRNGNGRPDGLELLEGPTWRAAGGLLLLLGGLFIAVAAAAWPVARRLTRRLEALQRGVETFGQGALAHRVAEDGRDEVSALARSFNQAAGRIESLVTANRQLLANASHELRSPLARLKMAVTLLEMPPSTEAPPATPQQEAHRREKLSREVHANIAELDEMVEEVLLASRLDAAPPDALVGGEPVDLRALSLQEAERARSESDGPPEWVLKEGPAFPDAPAWVRGDERLLRRALRNLLQNARRYGGQQADLQLLATPGSWVLSVEDRGPGVPVPLRERIFEPFFRLPGQGEASGGVGLGLSLVRQIAERHGGRVRCEGRASGGGPNDGADDGSDVAPGSAFRLELPAA